MSSDIIPFVSHGIVIDERYLDELEHLIVEIQNDDYSDPRAQQLLSLEGEIVVWQYRNETGSEEH
jgi:hypothetical protein